MATETLTIDLTAFLNRMSVAQMIPRAEVTPPQPDLPPDQLPDVSHMTGALDQALADLLAQWDQLSDEQKRQLEEQVRQAAQGGHLTDLLILEVGTGASTAALVAAMVALAAVASRQVVAEAATQGVEVATVHLPPATFEATAQVVAGLLADELRITAARAALHTASTATPDEVAQAARVALDALSDAGTRRQLGGTLHGAMNAARYVTLRHAPVGAIYASEVNDRNTCVPCREVNGRWLGNTNDPAMAYALYPDGAYGGYIGCLGGINCRGTITGVWRPKQTGTGGED